MKTISIGSAIIDIFVQSDHFKKDGRGQVRFGDESGKLDVDSFMLKPGGGGGNTAVGFSRLGFEASLISETGKDELAKLVVDDLKDEKVDVSMLVQERKEETGGAVILVAADGSRTIMVNRGAASLIDPADIKSADLEDADWVHVTNLSGRADTLTHLFQSLRFHGVKTSWNPGKADLTLIATGKLAVEDIFCRVLFLNKEEWELVEKQQDYLQKHIEQIVVTDGINGGRIFVKGGQRLIYGAQKVDAVDATGAGDGFAVGYVAGLLRGRTPEQSAAWGAENSASVVMQFGAKAGLKRSFD